MAANERFTYREFLLLVNRELVKACGFGIDDLPDYCYGDAFEDGMEIAEVVQEVMENARNY